MNFDFVRLLVTAAFAFSALILYQRWLEFSEELPLAAEQDATADQVPTTQAESVLPQVTQDLQAEGIGSVPVTDADAQLPSTATDVAGKAIASIGNEAILAGFDGKGNLVKVELLQHPAKVDGPPLELLTSNPNHLYVAQIGLLGDGLPSHQDPGWQLTGGQGEKISVSEWRNNSLAVTRSYLVGEKGYQGEVRLVITNQGATARSGHAYFQFLRNHQPPIGYSALIPSYYGAAIYTERDKYSKYDFDDLTEYPKRTNNGWIAIVQRYFMAAWLDGGGERENFMRKVGDDNVAIGIIRPLGIIAPGTTVTLTQPFFIGALEQDLLEKLDPAIGTGTQLAVDYGWLTIVSGPLFSLLSLIHGWVNNWGLSIIMLTFLIKLVFYPLMSKSYRSMARMKNVAPQMQKLKERHGDDRQAMQKKIMELYRKEKINPLGGCLPIVIQIPVFIALYWMLLESVELRQAPFGLWIQDLSSPDPYYILPVLLGGAMFGQFKLNPTPPDPTQALIMKIMPIGFGAFSIFFPCGLVVYWLTNTILSVAQQWHITRNIAKATAKRN